MEDKGAGISYCVFAYNVQPGIEIDYATGESKLADGVKQEEQKPVTISWAIFTSALTMCEGPSVIWIAG